MQIIKPIISSLSVAVFAAVITGCSSTTEEQTSSASSTTSSNSSSTYNAKELQAKYDEIAEREAAIARREASLANSSSAANAGAFSSDLLPPQGKPGECYARVWVDPTYRTISEQVLAKEASSRIEVIPATYETVAERVLVSEASTRLETIPAVYDKVTERKLVSEGGRSWKVDLAKNAAPASQKLLDTASSYGINLDRAEPGMCYHEHFLAAQYENVNEQVLVKEAYDVVSADEAQYRMIEKQVLVSEASSRVEEVPAVYETVTEQVVDVPAHTMWKKGTGPIQKINEATGEIMCLVEVPTTYKTISKRILVSPASTRMVEIPAVYETVKVRELASAAKEVRSTVPAEYKNVSIRKKVADPTFVWHDLHDNTMSKESRTGNKICLTEEAPRYETVTRTIVKTPAQTRTIEVPAEYKTVKVQKVVSKADQRVTEIPAEYKTVTHREIEKDGFMQWRSILCETNMNANTISGIQRALKERGYNPGTIDGVIGSQTIEAVNAFQRDEKLPVDKYLNMKTINALGVQI